jgi:RNA-directed DNA polymerase
MARLCSPGAPGFTFLSREPCSPEHSPQCIDTPANVTGSASYSARESAGVGNSAGEGTGVSRERSTAATTREASASHDAATGRLEQDGRRGPRTLSTSTQKPQGPVEARRRADEPGPHDDLMELVLSRRNMTLAYERVKANRGAPGVDGMTVDQFLEFARQHWDGIRSALRSGRYQPKPVRRTEIPKPTGGTRPLGIPTVLDRVIQQAIAQILTPICEAFFSDHSHGFRPGRRAHDAVRYVRDAKQKGHRFAVNADLSKFFDRVNHDVLMRLIAKHVRDPVLLRLIGRYLRAGVVIDGNVEATTAGVPQGGPLSPLLANVVLHELDCELERRGHAFARYADDFVILVKSLRAGERVLRSVPRFLATRLRLELNEAKSGVVPIDGCEFLGFTFRGRQIRWSDDVEREFKRRVRRLTHRSWGVSMGYRLAKLAEYVRGWIGYFGLSEYYTILPTLDDWLRRRVRLCYWKMWKRPARRIRQLIQLGTGRRSAILAGLSRKGYWRLSRTLSTHTGMTNAWLAKQGVLSLKALWVSIHYPEGASSKKRLPR